jgi:hypothetical protein
MKLSTISGLLIAAGAALMGYAVLIMDVSLGGSIVNLDMLNTRQNLVIVGAIMLLVGTIFLATSILVGKGHVSEDASKTVAPAGPNPVIQLLDGIWTRVRGEWRRVNNWRPGIVFRVACAVICSMNLAAVFPVLPWQPQAIGLAMFLPLSLRNLPAKMAISKTCFWAVAVTLPLNLIFLSAAISNLDLPITMATLNVGATLLLLGCYFIFKRK